MSETDDNRTCASLLARVNFPIYCIRAISERHFLIGGGGGMAKTGISNPFEIYELQYDRQLNTARATLVAHFDNGPNAIMNMAIIPKTKYHYELACGGMQGLCHIYDVRFKFKNGLTSSSSSSASTRRLSTYQHLINEDSSHSNLRRRHMSFSSQNSIEDIEESGLVDDINNGDDNVTKDNHSNPSIDDNHEKISTHASNNSNGNIADYLFEFELKKSFQTDFAVNEPYQKLIRYSLDTDQLITAGADGHISFWSLNTDDINDTDDQEYSRIARIKAHNNEIDDMDLIQTTTFQHLCTVSRDEQCSIWNIHDHKLVQILDYKSLLPKPNIKSDEQLKQLQKIKFHPRLCRYVTVEGDDTNIRLFVAVNNNCQKFMDSFILRWSISKNGNNSHEYYLEKYKSIGPIPLFAMSVNDDGRFLALGKQTGDIDVYITFSLQCCYTLQRAHNIFVTGIEFLPTKPESLQLMGVGGGGGELFGEVDAAFISISVDNRIVLHKIPKRATLGFFGSFAFFVIFILFIYIVMNYFDL